MQRQPRDVIIANPAGGYYSQDLVINDSHASEGLMRFASHGRNADEQLMENHFPNLVLLQRDGRGSAWGEAGEKP